MLDRNKQVIEDFRANAGKAGGPYADRPLLLLTTKGRKTGRAYTTPVMYLRDGERIAVFATKGGAPTHPDWYQNLVAHPTVTVEVGAENFEARASSLDGAERDQLYARQAELYPAFGEYQEKTSRKIPVVILERIAKP